jgi:hypothetical protein
MRRVLVPILLALLLASCTLDEVARSSYSSGKTACRLNPNYCTVHQDAQ